jgi:hypothetical protein
VAEATSNEAKPTSAPVADRIAALDFSALTDSSHDGNHRRSVSRDSARVLAVPSDWFALLDELAEHHSRSPLPDHNTGPNATEETLTSSANSDPAEEVSCVKDGSLGPQLASIGHRKGAVSGL